MANRKTRAMRRAEYLRQKNAMETQAKEALNQRAQATPDTEDTGHNVPQGGVNQQIQSDSPDKHRDGGVSAGAEHEKCVGHRPGL